MSATESTLLLSSSPPAFSSSRSSSSSPECSDAALDPEMVSLDSESLSQFDCDVKRTQNASFWRQVWAVLVKDFFLQIRQKKTTIFQVLGSASSSLVVFSASQCLLSCAVLFVFSALICSLKLLNSL
jgi:hypothetical protein